jgi:hypothetical protein
MAERNSIQSQSGKFLLISGIAALVILTGTLLFKDNGKNSPTREMRMAYQSMDSALKWISNHSRENGINLDPVNDPPETGMIGPELSEITTTAGDLAAKRTTLNPAFASLLVYYLTEAGVKRGDTIAIGSSGSFPGLMIASLAASKAMGLEEITILSIGASSFGASNPEFNIHDMYRLLQSKGWVTKDPAGVTPGGEMDGREGNSVERLAEAVAWRDSVYFRGGPGSVKAFINSGGSFANLGISPEVLKLRPGLILKAQLPDKDYRGMIFSMLAKGIPVIHLLNIREIARVNQLPWDSSQRQESEIPDFGAGQNRTLLIPSLLVILGFILFLVRFRLLDNRK